MRHLYASLVEACGVLLWAASRGEHDFHAFLNDDFNETLNFGVHQWNVDAPRLVGGGVHLVDVFDKGFGVHTASTQQSQTASIAHSGSQTPTATPYHTTSNHWILNSEKFCYSIRFHNYYNFIYSFQYFHIKTVASII